MATEHVTQHPDGTTERVVDTGGSTTVVEKSGSGGMGGVIIGLAVLALVAIVAFFLISSNRNDAIRTDAVTSAASSVADSAAGAADSVSNAVAPNK